MIPKAKDISKKEKEGNKFLLQITVVFSVLIPRSVFLRCFG